VIADTNPANLIAVRALPPVGLLGGGDTHFLGLTDGPHVCCVGVDAALIEVLSYKAGLLAGVDHEKAVAALKSRRSRDLMADCQLVVGRLQPLAVIWEIREGALVPFLLTTDGSVTGLSTTLAATIHIAFNVPLLVDGPGFLGLAVETKAPKWEPKDLFVYYCQRALGTEYTPPSFETAVPPQVAAFFEAMTAEPPTGDNDADEAPPS
jgi:hypothetical protein